MAAPVSARTAVPNDCAEADTIGRDREGRGSYALVGVKVGAGLGGCMRSGSIWQRSRQRSDSWQHTLSLSLGPLLRGLEGGEGADGSPRNANSPLARGP